MNNPIKVKMYGRGSFKPPVSNTSDIYAFLRQRNPSMLEHWLSCLGQQATIVLDAWLECSKDGWDGYKSIAITHDVLINTFKFLELLPKNLPYCDAAGEPDGDMGLDWYANSKSVLVSIGLKRIIMVSDAGTEQYKRTIEINNDFCIPPEFIEQLELLYSDASSTKRQ